MKTILTISLFLTFTFLSRAQIVSTYAGNGSAGVTGDGNVATNAKLNYPIDVATNENGDLYIVDFLNHKIRFVRYDNKEIGTLVFNDDAGNSIAPTHITYGEGVVYFLDTLGIIGNRLMKFELNGSNNLAEEVISLTQTFSYSGIVYSNNKLYISNAMNNTIDVISNLDATPTLSNLTFPINTFTLLNGITADLQGNLIVCDDTEIKKIDIQTNAVTTIGTGLYNPTGIDVASDGTIYISDVGTEKILKIDENGLSVFANASGTSGYVNGTAMDAQFQGPYGLTIDKDDNIYIADAINNVVRHIGCNYAFSPTVELSDYTEGDCPDELYFYVTDSDTKLNENTDWVWYVDGCGSSVVGTGDTLFFNPNINQSYFVRGEGGCFQPGICSPINKLIICNGGNGISTAFTPNADGVNDVWIIDNVQDSTTVYIYNRWGDLIKRIDNYSIENAWDGTSSESEKVSVGTYFYIIEKNNNKITSGWVQVVN